MKYIFVTGGVVSGLGKGITAASLGRLLKARGYKVAAQKLDPYINIDPGTMSPYQHGEVFVTEDGAETDLDLGHYERFIDEDLNKFSNLTTGKVYWNVLNKERSGEYLGQTVQVIPHITGEIKSFIYNVGRQSGADVVISEIGGTIGDIESQPFIEAIRQVSMEQGRGNCCFIHVTLVPYISGSCEFKSKPTQHSVRELQGMGIAPDIIVARVDAPLPLDIKKKIAMFCNVEEDCVIENRTLPLLYEAPVMLEEENFSSVVCRKLGLSLQKIDLSDWTAMLCRAKSCKRSVRIALVGKYVQLHDAYLSVAEALTHAGFANGVGVDIDWVDSEIAVIEFARGVLGIPDANSSEFDPEGAHAVVGIMPGQEGVKPGGTMRLGAYPCKIGAGTKLHEMYGKELVFERHRHRFECNNDYRAAFEGAGMTFSGTSPDGRLAEAAEIPANRFFIGVQFHPEFKSRPNAAHPLFCGFVRAAAERAQKREKS